MTDDRLVVPLQPGTVLQDYIVNRLLGQGGFGTTYLAVDQRLQKPVVLKELTPRWIVRRQSDARLIPAAHLAAVFEAMKQRFLSEARLGARFRHPNMASVLRFFEAHQTAYMVMEYEVGTTMSAWLRSAEGHITEDELEALFLPICDALDMVHKEGLIHRDVKPDNIIVRPDGSPCLIDFGAAVRYIRRPGEDGLPVIATPCYAPPEQFDPVGVQGPWTDIYALGATLYEIVTGDPPPPSQHRSTEDQLIPASQRASGKYSSRLLSVVDQCLALDPKERPGSVQDMISALRPDDDGVFAYMLRVVSLKMIDHFLNWAAANEHLLADELAIFITTFPIIDLSWRLGEGLPSHDMFTHLYDLSTSPPATLDAVFEKLVPRGFVHARRNPTSAAVLGRLDEYAASYLLDRHADQWSYEVTRAQLIKQCLVSPTEGDRDGFSSLMEDVIDGGRGRLKREFGKAFNRVAWHFDPVNGWTKTVRRQAATGKVEMGKKDIQD